MQLMRRSNRRQTFLESSARCVHMSKEDFDPRKKFQPIIDQLIKEGRMPTLQEYLAAVEKVRRKYRNKLEELRRREKQADMN